MTIHNVMELQAREMLESEEVQSILTCHCQNCQDDVLAIALNHLPSRYVSTDQGELFVKANYMRVQLQSDVLLELIRATELVSKKPRHGVEQSQDGSTLNAR